MLRTGISDLAVVQTDALGENVSVGEFAIIRAGAVVGANVVIHPHAIIREGVAVGDDAVIHPHVVIEAGTVIGRGVELFPGAYLGKEPKTTGATSRPLDYEGGVRVGDYCSINPHAIIYRDVVIGERTLVGDGASIREGARIGARCVIGRYVTINYAVSIGDRTKIMDHTWLAGNMEIGADVFISGGVMTANDNAMGQRGYDEARIQGPTIADRALIGVAAILLPNLTIGEAATVGAGAVVTRDVEPHTTVKGIPARVLTQEVKSR